MKKKTFQMPSSVTTLLLLICIMAVLTYIVPAGQYTYENGVPIAGSYQTVAQTPQGFWNILEAPVRGFREAIEIILFVLVLGGCLGIVFETKAIEAGLLRVAQRFEGREKYLIPMILILCSFGGSAYGMAEETIAFYPLIMPILLAAGYDVVTGVMVVFLGAGAGIAGGLINPFSIGIASSLANISLSDGMGVRFILYLCLLSFTITFVMRYAERVRKDPTKSIVYDIKAQTEEHFIKAGDDIELTTKRKIILLVFSAIFFFMILGIIPWASKFDILVFENAHNYLKNETFIGYFIGSLKPLGEWHFKEMTVLFLLGSIVIGKVYGLKEGELVRVFTAGCKDIFSVAICIAVAKGISIIMQDGNIIGTILHTGETMLQGINGVIFPAISYILFIGLTFLIPSSSGLATATIPIFAPLGEFIGVEREYIAMALQAGAETMNFMSPTQVVLIGALSICNVPYSRWLKHIFPFVCGVIIITITVLTVANILN